MSRPIRVAHVVGSTGVYGAEQWIFALLRHLPPDRATGLLVNLVDAPVDTSAVVAAARARDLHAIDLPTGGRFNPRAVWRLARLARAHGCDVLHSHGHKADLTALLAARLSRLATVSTPHGWSKESDRRLEIYERLDRYLLRFFDVVCPLSPDLRDGLVRSGVRPGRVRMALNAVDIEAVDRVSPGRRPDAAGTVVGYVGQLIARKNVECLIRAFDGLSRQREDMRLVLVGDGPRASALHALAGGSRRIEFAGYRADAIAVLKSFDVLVLPSWQEGIPRCLMEGMAAGIPVVASDIPGNRDLVEHGVTGLLFSPGRPEELQQAILDTIENPERAKDMARRARHAIEQRFSAARMARDYADIYERCSRSSS